MQYMSDSDNNDELHSESGSESSSSEEERRKRRKKKHDKKKDKKDKDSNVALVLYQRIDVKVLHELNKLELVGPNAAKLTKMLADLCTVSKNSSLLMCKYESKGDKDRRIYGHFERPSRQGAKFLRAPHTLYFPKAMQKMLTRMFVHDVDLNSSAQTTLLHYAKEQGLQLPRLELCVEDRPRLFDLMRGQGMICTDAEFKELVLKVTHGWGGEITCQVLQEYKNEILLLTERLKVPFHKEWQESLTIVSKDPTKNLHGVFTRHVSELLERKILMSAMEFFIKDRKIPVQSYELDGLKVEREQGYTGTLDPQIITDLNDYVRAKTGVTVRFVEKSMELSPQEELIIYGPKDWAKLGAVESIVEAAIRVVRTKPNMGLCRQGKNVMRKHPTVPCARVVYSEMDEFLKEVSSLWPTVAINGSWPMWRTWFECNMHPLFPIVTLKPPKDIIAFQNGFVTLEREGPRFTQWTHQLLTDPPFMTDHFFDCQLTPADFNGQGVTSALDQVLNHQFEAPAQKVIRAFIGRNQFPIGFDHWEKALLLIGIAGSGKSTVMDTITASLPAGSVFIIGAGHDPKYGLADLKKPCTRAMMVEDAPANLSQIFPQSDMQSIISGGLVAVGQKNEDTVTIPNIVPLTIATNHSPNWLDGSGQTSRRMVVAQFTKPVLEVDTTIKSRLKEEIVATLFKCIRDYYDLLKQTGGLSLDRVLPKELAVGAGGLRRSTQDFEKFYDDYIIEDPNGFVSKNELKGRMEQFYDTDLKFTRKVWDGNDQYLLQKGIKTKIISFCKACNKHAKKGCCADYSGINRTTLVCYLGIRLRTKAVSSEIYVTQEIMDSVKDDAPRAEPEAKQEPPEQVVPPLTRNTLWKNGQLHPAAQAR